MKTSHMLSARLLWSVMTGSGLALVPGSGALAAEPVSPWDPLGPSRTQVTCFGSNRTVYSPPVTAFPQSGSMTHSAQYGVCLPAYGQSISSATVAATTVDSVDYTCNEILSSAPEHVTIAWDNGERSELSLATAEVNVQATTTTVTSSGEVVNGKFKGMSAVRSWTFLNTDLTTRCRSSGGLPETNVFALLVLTRLPTDTR